MSLANISSVALQLPSSSDVTLCDVNFIKVVNMSLSHYQDFPWIEADEHLCSLSDSRMIPLKMLTSDLIKVD